MLAPTHLIFALAVAHILRFPVLPAAIGGIIADLDLVLDYGFPFIHRGIIHTPIILGVSIIIIYMVTRRTDYSLSFGAGYLSHLLLDIITPSGILILYPLPIFYSLNLAYYSNILANLGIIIWSSLFILLIRKNYFTKIGVKI